MRFLSILLLGLSLTCGAAWYDSDWGNAFKFTVPAESVDADLTDYPVYFDLADIGTGHPFWGNVRSDGGDIRITTSNGTTEVEVEVVDIDTTAKTGEVHFLAAGTLSSTVDTTFWVYYNAPSETMPATTDTYGRNAVWVDFIAVHHMVGGAADMTDSTGNGYDMDFAGPAPARSTDAAVGGDSFNSPGNGGYLVAPSNAYQDDDIPVNGDYTLSAWVKFNSSGYNGFFSSGVNGNEQLTFLRTNGGKLRAWNRYEHSTTVSDSTWTYWAYTYDHSATEETLYVNDDAGETNSSSVPNSRDSRDMLYATLTTGSFSQNGYLDEVRVRAEEMSDDWIATTYKNQNSPSTFYVIGVEEEEDDSTSWHDSSWDHRIPMVVQAHKVGASDSDFPVYVNLGDISSDHDFWTGVLTSGADLRVTDSNGTTEVEVEVVDIDTTAKTGEVHFLAGSISPTSNTRFFLYYGNSDASLPATTDTYGRDAVWGDYKFVYHLGEDSGSTAFDSAGNSDGTYSAGSTDNTAVQLGDGQQFTGDTSDEITGAGTSDSFTASTLQGWFEATSDWVSGIEDVYRGSGHILERGNYGGFRVRHEDLSDSFYSISISADIADGLQMVHSTYDGTTKYGYLNGAQSASEAATGTIVPSSYTSDKIGRDWPGKIDELRLRDTALDAEWVESEYNNQGTSSEFLKYGEEQDSPPVTTIPQIIIIEQ